MSTEARYRCVDVSLFRMGGHMAMAQGQVSGSLQLLDGPLLQLLVGCGTFLTLREHAEALAPACRAAPADLLPRLAQLARAGLLLSYDDVRARILSATQPPPPPISAISIVTRDRPAALLRAAEGLADNCRAHGRSPALYVLDDSAPAAQAESRAALAELQRRGPLRVHHLGAEEKRALQEALRRGAGVPAEIVEFALGNPCGAPRFGGANYNAMLLRGAGALHVSVDDDTVCRLARLGASPALRISAQHDVTELLVMEGREAVLGQVRAEERDLLALHEELLGRGPARAAPGARRPGPGFGTAAPPPAPAPDPAPAAPRTGPRTRAPPPAPASRAAAPAGSSRRSRARLSRRAASAPAAGPDRRRSPA